MAAGKIKAPSLGRPRKRTPKFPANCPACQAVLLSTEQLSQISEAELQALLDDNREGIKEDEAYRHNFMKERWHYAQLWKKWGAGQQKRS